MDTLARDASASLEHTRKTLRWTVALAGMVSLASPVAVHVRLLAGAVVGCCAAYALVVGRDYVDAPHTPDRVAGVREHLKPLLGSSATKPEQRSSRPAAASRAPATASLAPSASRRHAAVEVKVWMVAPALAALLVLCVLLVATLVL